MITLTFMNRQVLASLIVVATASGALAQEARESLTIHEAIEMSRSRNERVLIARADVQAAEARLARARSFFFPDVTLNGTYTRRGYETVREIGGEDVTISSRDGLNGTAVVSAPLFDARAFPLLRQARFERESVVLTAGNIERLVGFDAAVGFLQTLGAEQIMAAAERRLEYARTNLSDARARLEGGLVSSNDVTRAELELANAELAVERARSGAETARIALEELLAIRITGSLVPPADLLVAAQTADPDPETLAADAVAARFDLRAAEARVSALDAFADEPRRRFLPRLGFAGQHRVTNEGGISGRDEDTTAAVNMTWPLWDGGDARAERREREANARAAELELEMQRREAVTQIRTAVTTLEREQSAIRSASIAAGAAQRNAAETNILYREGLATSLELADAGVQLFEAESEQVRAQYDLAIAWLDMRAAAGLEPAPSASAATD